MSKLISQLPEDIRVIALQRQREETSEEFDKNTDVLSEAFHWDNSLEMYSIWESVDDGNYTPFREFHAKQKQAENNGWISVSERVPEGRMATVLAYYQKEHYKSHYFVANYYNETGWASELPYIPTHWQPLPEPPKTN